MADCGNENGNAIGGLPDRLQGLTVSDDNKQRKDQTQNKRSSGNTNLTEGCSICQDDMKIDTGLKKLPTCEHIFHLECIDRWLQKHVRCPICRRHVGKEYLLALRLHPCTNDGTACSDSDIESDDESVDVFGSGEQDYDGGSRELCRSCGAYEDHSNVSLVHFCPLRDAYLQYMVLYDTASPIYRNPQLLESLQSANISRINSGAFGNSVPLYTGPPVNGANSRYGYPPHPGSALSANINHISPQDFSNSTHANARPPVFGADSRYGYPQHSANNTRFY